MIDPKELRQLRRAMTHAVFSGVFWAILATSLLGALIWVVLLVNGMYAEPTVYDQL